LRRRALCFCPRVDVFGFLDTFLDAQAFVFSLAAPCQQGKILSDYYRCQGIWSSRFFSRLPQEINCLFFWLQKLFSKIFPFDPLLLRNRPAPLQESRLPKEKCDVSRPVDLSLPRLPINLTKAFFGFRVQPPTNSFITAARLFPLYITEGISNWPRPQNPLALPGKSSLVSFAMVKIPFNPRRAPQVLRIMAADPRLIPLLQKPHC